MKFENIEIFKTFIESNLKMPFGTYDFSACVADFERQVNESETYELSGSETNSGEPESIGFERVDRFYIDGKEVPPCDDFDFVETTIIF